VNRVDRLQAGKDAPTATRGDELVKLAEDLQAALANDDIRRARQAHGALGRQLERADADGAERVVDLARERAQRRGKR
jgi:hypothetical protein